MREGDPAGHSECLRKNVHKLWITKQMILSSRHLSLLCTSGYYCGYCGYCGLLYYVRPSSTPLQSSRNPPAFLSSILPRLHFAVSFAFRSASAPLPSKPRPRLGERTARVAVEPSAYPLSPPNLPHKAP